MSEDYLNALQRSTEPRYASCLVLDDSKIPYVIWFEDALSYHGVPTAVFKLYILVTDINLAADCLVQAGWTVDTQSPHKVGNAEVKLPQVPLLSPTKETKSVCLQASDWRFPLNADTHLERAFVKDIPDRELLFPPLPALLDALVESWFDAPDGHNEALQLHLAIQFGYLYEYVPSLKERSFAERMKYEHRQLHYDILSGMEFSTIPFRNHELPTRDALRKGDYQLRECSMSREENIWLFDAFAGARIPDPPGDESTE